MLQRVQPFDSLQDTSSAFGRQDALGWVAIWIIALVGIGGAIAGLNSVLRIIFPMGSLAVGFLLYQRYPLLYLGFTWWLWFLVPLLRRLADYYTTFDPSGLILTAPYLVTFLTVITLLKNLPQCSRDGNLPFVLGIFGIIYGTLIGLLNNSMPFVIRAFLDWMPPVLFGFHLAVMWRHYPAIQKNIKQVFLWAVIITGTYGIYQYMVAPAWDCYWLESVENVTFGLPEPRLIRVWSTMNSPPPFGCFMLVGTLLLFSIKSKFRLLASGAGYLALLLSLVRAAWGGWIVGVITLISALRSNLQIRLFMTISAIAVCVLPLTTLEAFSGVIGDRVGSVSNLQTDSSLNARIGTYSGYLGDALLEVVGRGMGGTWDVNEYGQTERIAFDSSFLDALFSLGWIGTSLYLGGMFLLLWSQFKGQECSFDPFAGAARAITIGLFSTQILGPFMTGLPGMLLWSFLGVGLAARKYYFAMKV